jgi:hypothetical protein
MARPAIHPGEILADELLDIGISPTELARKLSKASAASLEIPHCGWGIGLATALCSGSICKAHMICVWRKLKRAKSFKNYRGEWLWRPESRNIAEASRYADKEFH